MATYNSFIFAGHGKSEKTGAYDPGATSGGTYENDIANKIVTSAINYLKPTGLIIHRDENNYTDDDLAGNTYTAKCGVSIHINAGGGTGPEIYVPCKEKTLESDFEIVDQIAKLLGTPNRGVKSRDYNSEQMFKRTNGVALNYLDYYKEIRQAWEKGISLAILEVGFIDTADLSKMLGRIDELGYLVARYIAKNSGKELIKPTVPAPTPSPSDVMYRVICGSYKDRANAEAQQNKLKQAGFDSFLEVKK